MVLGLSADLSALNERSREVFRRLVESYLDTGEPVGSRHLSRLLPMSLSPASIRHVMSDLEQLGLIYAPHISAGRLPTTSGLRFFVDSIMEFGDLGEEDRANIETKVRVAGQGGTLEGVLSEASALLSGMTRGAGVVLSSKVDSCIRHIEFVRLEPTKALVILVAEDGLVENRVVDLPLGLPANALVEASNYLNAHLRGMTLTQAQREIERLQLARQSELDALTSRLIEDGLAVWAGAGEGASQLIVHGRANLLENITALEDVERVRLLFDDLERQRDIIQLLGATDAALGVRIYIGSENKLFSLSGSSLVAAPFKDKNQKIIGVLGVIGPTRLNYARIVPMVDFTAKVVGALF